LGRYFSSQRIHRTMPRVPIAPLSSVDVPVPIEVTVKHAFVLIKDSRWPSISECHFRVIVDEWSVRRLHCSFVYVVLQEVDESLTLLNERGIDLWQLSFYVVHLGGEGYRWFRILESVLERRSLFAEEYAIDDQFQWVNSHG